MVAVKNIARRLGDDISEQKPILDSRLPDGSRVAAVIPPCSIHGVTLTIRKFNGRHFTIEDLVKCGSLDAALVAPAEELRRETAEHSHQRRNRHRQNNALERSWESSFRTTTEFS